MDNRINKTEMHDDDLRLKNQHVLFTWANYMLSTGVIILNLDFGLIFIVFINMRHTPSL